MNNVLVAGFAAFAYLAAWAVIVLRLFRTEAGERLPRWTALAGIGVGLLSHGLLLFQDTLMGFSGFNFGFFNAFSVAAWTIVLILLFSSLTKPVENVGVVILPVAATAVVLDVAFETRYLLSPGAHWGLSAHILVSLLAYSTLAMASVQAVLLAVQDRHLHRHHPGGFIRGLPPLQTMESLLFEMIGFGFGLLSLSLISGFLYLDDLFAQHVAHKTVLSILAWGLFGVLLWGRFRHGWRGKKAIKWTLSGFVMLMLAYFGSKAVIELILNR